MVKQNFVNADGSKVDDHKVVRIMQVSDVFTVRVDSLGGVSPDQLRDVIQAKFKVAHILHTDSNKICKRL